MKNYTDNDYAVNKHSKGIVYRFADGTVEVTLEAYLSENPDKTEKDFHELKALSDDIYLEQDRDGYRQTYKNVSIHGLDETDACATPSPEDSMIEQMEQSERDSEQRHRREIGLQAFEKLTIVQQRRYLLHHVDGLTMREIAEIEGTKHQAIVQCIAASEKKIKKLLGNT